MGKDPGAGRDWGQEEKRMTEDEMAEAKGTTEDEMAGWHHQLNGQELG